ncbi:MAG: hypothetical protein WAK17_25350 [Candidatus Nitrosopolaris sp.]
MGPETKSDPIAVIAALLCYTTSAILLAGSFVNSNKPMYKSSIRVSLKILV